jgi:hypothetical protein
MSHCRRALLRCSCELTARSGRRRVGVGLGLGLGGASGDAGAARLDLQVTILSQAANARKRAVVRLASLSTLNAEANSASHYFSLTRPASPGKAEINTAAPPRPPPTRARRPARRCRRRCCCSRARRSFSVNTRAATKLGIHRQYLGAGATFIAGAAAGGGRRRQRENARRGAFKRACRLLHRPRRRETAPCRRARWDARDKIGAVKEFPRRAARLMLRHGQIPQVRTQFLPTHQFVRHSN